jgi:hypothetical protein
VAGELVKRKTALGAIPQSGDPPIAPLLTPRQWLFREFLYSPYAARTILAIAVGIAIVLNALR